MPAPLPCRLGALRASPSNCRTPPGWFSILAVSASACGIHSLWPSVTSSELSASQGAQQQLSEEGAVVRGPRRACGSVATWQDVLAVEAARTVPSQLLALAGAALELLSLPQLHTAFASLPVRRFAWRGVEQGAVSSFSSLVHQPTIPFKRCNRSAGLGNRPAAACVPPTAHRQPTNLTCCAVRLGTMHASFVPPASRATPLRPWRFVRLNERPPNDCCCPRSARSPARDVVSAACSYIPAAVGRAGNGSTQKGRPARGTSCL